MRLSVLLVALLMGGCSLGSRVPEQGPAPLPADYSETTGSLPQAADSRWWTAFRDPVLDHAIAQAMSGNLDLKIALLRIDEADSNVVVAGSGGLPSISFDASRTRTKQTGKMKEISGWVEKSVYGVSANWLIDIFGEVRSQVSSARATREASVEAVAIARPALLSDIAAAYIDARYYQELGAIGTRTVASRQRTLDLTMALERQGVASRLDVDKAQEAVNAVQADLPEYDANFRRAANRLATLMGKPAGEVLPGLHAAHGQPLPSYDPDTGMPADLVRNRPDIRKAELEFAAAVADIGYAEAQLYPAITLSGSITPSYISTNLKSGSLTTWSFGPTLRLPIFEGGRLRANVKIAQSRAQQKELAWRNSVLKAVEEVENALIAYKREQVALKSLRNQERLGKQTVMLSANAYREGLKSLLETLDSERRLFEAQSSLAASRRKLALNFIALNIAVGRGLPGPASVALAGGTQCPPDCQN